MGARPAVAAEMKEFRNVLREAVEKRVFPGSHALLFSGGTDSLTILWTLLDLGIGVNCYTFRLESVESNDSKAARIAADHWKVPLEIVSVPTTSLSVLAEEIRLVTKIIGSSRKTHVEVMWPLWHVARCVREENVWSGLQADTLYGSTRSMIIKYHRDPQAFLETRAKLVAKPDQEGFAQAVRLFGSFGKQFYAPYTDPAVREFMMCYSWQQLNKPRQKMPAVLSFAKEFREVPLYRKNDNLQCGSGVREHMARMLAAPSVNVNGRKRIAALYKDFLAA